MSQTVIPRTMPSAAAMDMAKAHLLQNYKQQPIVLTEGKGAELWDAEGRRYLDFLGGIATCGLGHCDPDVVAAVKAQADKLWHVSNVFYSLPSIQLAEKLTKASGLDRAFFCNSGAEANEALIKLARKSQKDRGQPGRFEILTFENSFHGRTLATLTATGQPKYQKGFEPLPEGFRYVPYGDLEAVKAAVSGKTAAILVEPIQGEGGVRPAPEGFLQALREICDREGALLLIDEVQTGMGRTGKMFAYQHSGIRPDGVSMAKALGNGIPIGAMLCREDPSKSLVPGTHGSTFGGNLLAAAAANAVFDKINAPGFFAEVESLGARMRSGLEAIRTRHPDRTTAVRGSGMLWGLEVTVEAAKVVANARDRGLLCNLAGEKTVRFAPPLNLPVRLLDEGLAVLESALAAV